MGPKDIINCNKIIAALEEHGELTTPQIRAMTGITPATYEHYMRLLFKERLVYVKDWKQILFNGLWIRIFAIGDHDNMPKPSIEQARRRYLQQKSIDISKDMTPRAEEAEKHPKRKRMRRFVYS